MAEIEKVVIVTQPTWLDGLVEKFNTKQQARFYIEHMGGNFEEYFLQHEQYYQGLRSIKQSIPRSLRYQVVDKSFLPNFLFGDHDLIIVYGRDGLVINTAKYLNEQPILGVNPNPDLNAGILLLFQVEDVNNAIGAIMDDKLLALDISMVKAETNNGQVLYGVNDLFIGHQSHQSARYSIKFRGEIERHSSSGIIVSTGMGSTGWFKSVVQTSLNTVNRLFGEYISVDETDCRFDWDAPFVRFCVREAWSSSNTGNSMTYDTIYQDEVLILESHMPEGGVIFGDGMEEDRIHFNSGTIVRVQVAERTVKIYTN